MAGRPIDAGGWSFLTRDSPRVMLSECVDERPAGELGKKLDFLLQEMNRETNTVLSKTNGLGEIGLRITDLALGAKADIEKIREQSLNLE